MNIVIAGGSGFVGTALAKRLVKEKNSVTIVDRNRPPILIEGVEFIHADLTRDPVPPIFGECDAVVNLLGANIFNRWTNAYKKIILSSRTTVTHTILAAIKNSKHPPSVFVSASAVGYYGDRKEEMLFEKSAPGTDFLASVCVAWEAAAAAATAQGMRWVSIRTAIVLGPGGGMIAQLAPLYRWGLGGRLGSGNQWFTWVHIDDLVEIYTAAIMNKTISGPVNAGSPGVLRNKDFNTAMGTVLHRPTFIPIPGWALRIVLGEFATAVLSSQHVIPKKLTDVGFIFSYSTIDSALKSIFSQDR